MVSEYLENPMIEEIVGTSTMEKIRNAYAVFEKAFNALADGTNDERTYYILKVGTTVGFNVVKRIANGQDPRKFTERDWEEIVKESSIEATSIDDNTFSAGVFMAYADYIGISAENIKNAIAGKSYEAILALSDEIRNKTELLRTGNIQEAVYVEECLWISLEAMIKLFSSLGTAVISKFSKEEAGELFQAMSDFAFEYARLRMYAKEKQLITAYMENQQRLDDELQEEYDSYIKELNEYSSLFNSFVENAFASDMRNSLRASAAMARAAGVAKEEILNSEDEIDDFFMN